MSFFQRVTKTVQIDEENSVEVRKLNYGERQQCMSKAMKVSAAGDSAAAVNIDAPLLALEMLKFAIVSWNGPGFESRPVTPANIESLPGEVAELLSRSVDSWNQALDDTEKKD
jgi:hypothetical protein